MLNYFLKGNVTVVTELLKGGTYRSIDAKNEVGLTAIHLAASLGNHVILKLLVQGGGNVNIKDDADLTALHVIHIRISFAYSITDLICSSIYSTPVSTITPTASNCCWNIKQVLRFDIV